MTSLFYNFAYNYLNRRRPWFCPEPHQLLEENPLSLRLLLERQRFLAASSEYGSIQPSANDPAFKSNERPVTQTPHIKFPMLVYSHRGGSFERDPQTGDFFVENTLPAFRNSAAMGVDLLELDVQMTRDGRAVVFHDNELSRIFGPSYTGRRIAEYNYEDLPARPDAGYSYHPRSMYERPNQPPSKWWQRAHAQGNVTPQNSAGQSPALDRVVQPQDRITEVVAVETNKLILNPTETSPLIESTNNDRRNGEGKTVHAERLGPSGRRSDRYRIPLFEEILQEFPGVPIQVDLKAARGPPAPVGAALLDASSPSTSGTVPRVTRIWVRPGTSSPHQHPPSRLEEKLELVQEVHGLLRLHGRSARDILWGSFDHQTNSLCYLQDPGLPLFASAARGVTLLAAHKAGRLGEVPVYESALIQPRNLPGVRWRGKGCGEAVLLDPAWHEALGRRGVSVIVYGDLNDEETFEKLRESAARGLVRGICTDAPSKLEEFLGRHGIASQVSA